MYFNNNNDATTILTSLLERQRHQAHRLSKTLVAVLSLSIESCLVPYHQQFQDPKFTTDQQFCWGAVTNWCRFTCHPMLSLWFGGLAACFWSFGWLRLGNAMIMPARVESDGFWRFSVESLKSYLKSQATQNLPICCFSSKDSGCGWLLQNDVFPHM